MGAPMHPHTSSSLSTPLAVMVTVVQLGQQPDPRGSGQRTHTPALPLPDDVAGRRGTKEDGQKDNRNENIHRC